MNLTWTRNDREIWYLAAIVLVSLILAPPCMSSLLPIDLLPLWIPVWIYIALLFLIGPVLPHLPAFVYGTYTSGWAVVWKKNRQSMSLNYLSAFLISALISVFVNMYVDIRVCALVSPHKPYPVWYIDVAIVAVTLLIPTFHAYFAYEKYRDIGIVVMLVLIYAPWVQFVRLFSVYMRFI